MSNYSNGSGNVPQLPDRVVDTLIDSAGVSTYHPEGSQLEKLHALAHGVAEELLARLPSAPAPAPVASGVQVTDAMLEAAMKAAVATGMLPKQLDSATYLKNWGAMKQVLGAAFAVAA